MSFVFVVTILFVVVVVLIVVVFLSSKLSSLFQRFLLYISCTNHVLIKIKSLFRDIIIIIFIIIIIIFIIIIIIILCMFSCLILQVVSQELSTSPLSFLILQKIFCTCLTRESVSDGDADEGRGITNVHCLLFIIHLRSAPNRY